MKLVGIIKHLFFGENTVYKERSKSIIRVVNGKAWQMLKREEKYTGDGDAVEILRYQQRYSATASFINAHFQGLSSCVPLVAMNNEWFLNFLLHI